MPPLPDTITLSRPVPGGVYRRVDKWDTISFGSVPSRVVRVEFWLDDTLWSADDTPVNGFDEPFDVTLLDVGIHTLRVVGYDAQGRSASYTVSFEVS